MNQPPTIGDRAHFIGDGIHVVGVGKVATIRRLAKGGYSLRGKLGRAHVYLSGPDQTAIANDFLINRHRYLQVAP